MTPQPSVNLPTSWPTPHSKAQGSGGRPASGGRSPEHSVGEGEARTAALTEFPSLHGWRVVEGRSYRTDLRPLE
jgi:hypothetical protein